MRKIVYIINPIAGSGNRSVISSLVESKTAERKIPFAVYPSVASGDYRFLRSLVEEERYTDVVVAGGDGTVSQVIQSMMDLKVNIGIIPCGSGNGLAFAAGIPKNPSKALEVVFANHSLLTDGFYINGIFSCMLSGLGFDAQVAHDFAQQPRRGLATYIRQVMKNFFSAKAYSFDIEVEGKNFSTDAFFLSIANSNQFGNNFRIAPKASLRDGLLDIVILCRQNKFSLILQTMKQLVGMNRVQSTPLPGKKRLLIYFQVPEIHVRNISGAPLHIDGEPYETPETVDVSVCKHCFRLLQP